MFSGSQTGTCAGDRKYMSPQVSRGFWYDNKTDIWSMGVTFIEIITLEYPNMTIDGWETPFPIERINYQDKQLLPLCRLICSKMLVCNDKKRASIKEVIADEVFKNHFPRVKQEADRWQQEEEALKREHVNQMQETSLNDQAAKLKADNENLQQAKELEAELKVVRLQVEAENEEQPQASSGQTSAQVGFNKPEK